MTGLCVIGIGARDRGDDAVGPCAIDRLQAIAAAGKLPPFDLIALSGEASGLVAAWADARAAIVIDAAMGGGRVGAIRRLAPNDAAIAVEAPPVSSHSAGLAQAIALSDALATTPPRLTLYLVTGRQFGFGDPLSPEVSAALPELMRRVERDIDAIGKETARHA